MVSRFEESAGKRRGAGARGRILDAAQKLFAEDGFAATATKRIGEEAGVPSGLIFYHFETKQGLLEALIKERSFLPELRAMVEASADADPRSTLFNVGVRFSEALRREESMVRILLGEFLTNEAVSGSFHELTREARRLIASYLDDAVRTGRLRPVGTKVLARSYLSSILFTFVFLERPDDPERAIDEIVELLVGNRLPEGPESEV